MTQLWRVYSGLIPFAALLLLVVFAVAALVYRRRSRRGVPRAGLVTMLDALILGYVTCLLLLTLSGSIGQPRSLNLVPFREWAEVVHDRGYYQAQLVEAVGNVVMFVPLGLLVGLRWRRSDTFLRAVALVSLLGLAIELLQVVLGLGRVASITDVLAAAIGAALGRGLLVLGGHESLVERRSANDPRPDPVTQSA